jgi:conjugal transfer pilus assembly protein TraL
MENNRIFQYLDSPTRFLYWRIDEALSFFMPFLIGLVSDHLFIGIFASVFSFRFYRKLTSKFNSGFIKHISYWYLPSISSRYLKKTPPSWTREYLG